MEFLVCSSGAIIPDPEAASSEQLAKTQAAMGLFRANADRVKHFTRRVAELGRSSQDTVITVINVDDPIGGVLAGALMPGHDWQSYRDAGEVPVARGLADKDAISGFLGAAGFNTAQSELMNTDDLRVVVPDAGVALVLDVEFKD